MILKTPLDAIGHTPLLNLKDLVGTDCFVKMEYLNPSGSIKDRIALEMINAAIKTGKLKKGMSIVEATSGNTGIALAMVGSALGYPVTIVMPENMSIERQQAIKAYGANVILTPAKDSVNGAVKKAKEIASQGMYYMPSQFDNPANVAAQRKTAQEALEELDCQVDVLISGIGSGGTLEGMSEVLLAANPKCRIVAVEPYGVSCLKGDPPKIHAIQGIGDGFIPAILNKEIVDEIIEVKDNEAIAISQLLAKQYGLLVGISSGANIFAAVQIAKKYGPHLHILTVLPDRGERYFSTEVV